MPNWTKWGSGPGTPPEVEQAQLEYLADQFDQMTGGQISITPAELLAMANAGITSQLDFGQWMLKNSGAGNASVLARMPWAEFGLIKDAYEQLATTYATVYESVTGQAISPEALMQAFQTPNLLAGGMLSGSQYEQQLMHSAAIQQMFGWVKFGLNYTQWSQQKLSLQQNFGRTINDSEANLILTYTHPTQGSTMTVTGGASHAAQGQQATTPGVSQSVVR